MSAAIVESETMSSHWTPASSVLAAELWVSFVGLLRSHVAMRSVIEPNANWQIHSNSPSGLEVGALDNRLWVTAPESSRPGSINRVPQVRETGSPASGLCSMGWEANLGCFLWLNETQMSREERGASGAPEDYTFAETALAQSEKSERFANFYFAEDGRVCFASPAASAEASGMEMEAAVEFLLDALRGRRSA